MSKVNFPFLFPIPFYSLSIPFPFPFLTWIIEKHWGGPTSNIWVKLGVQSCPRGSWTIDCGSWTRYPTRTCTVTCIASSSVASDLEIEIKYNYKFIFYSLFVLFVSVDTFQEGYMYSLAGPDLINHFTLGLTVIKISTSS